MTDPIAQLLARPDVEPSPPAAPADIDAVARHLGGPLPDELARLWRAADGVDLGPIDARLLGASDARSLVEGWDDLDEWAGPGFVPLLDDHESNYVGLCGGGPLAPRVLWFPHDDDSRLLYREVGGLFRDLMTAVAGEERASGFFREAAGDYPPDGHRTARDLADARVLLAVPDHESDGDWPKLLAIQLLDASWLDEWAALLETGHFVRRDVLARLEAMDDPAIRALLARDRAAFDEFAIAVADAARAAGFDVGERQGTALKVGGRGKELEFAFHRRHIPDALPRLMTWFRDQAEGRNPHDRPGHFLADG